MMDCGWARAMSLTSTWRTALTGFLRLSGESERREPGRWGKRRTCFAHSALTYTSDSLRRSSCVALWRKIKRSGIMAANITSSSVSGRCGCCDIRQGLFTTQPRAHPPSLTPPPAPMPSFSPSLSTLSVLPSSCPSLCSLIASFPLFAVKLHACCGWALTTSSLSWQVSSLYICSFSHMHVCLSSTHLSLTCSLRLSAATATANSRTHVHAGATAINRTRLTLEVRCA